VIVGTRALQDSTWFREMATRYPDRLVLGLDARDGRVATGGWLDVSSVEAATLARQFDDLPLAAVIYTDIARDGMMQGVNIEATAALHRAVPHLHVIASGGVTDLDDLRRLDAAGVPGAIVGRALYEGRIALREAVNCLSPPSNPAG